MHLCDALYLSDAVLTWPPELLHDRTIMPSCCFETELEKLQAMPCTNSFGTMPWPKYDSKRQMHNDSLHAIRTITE
eukprot:scaffold81881_cov18-Prasinocladus_malaysianus.AAC.2